MLMVMPSDPGPVAHTDDETMRNAVALRTTKNEVENNDDDNDNPASEAAD